MIEKPIIKIIRLKPKQDNDIPLPQYMTKGSVGMDLHASINKPIVLKKNQIAMIPSGFALAIPEGFEIQIRPRSGLAIKYGVTVINSPGTIDSDYRGELKIGLINHGTKEYLIKRGDRIAQMVVSRVFQATFNILENLDETFRNTGGLGHTGK